MIISTFSLCFTSMCSLNCIGFSFDKQVYFLFAASAFRKLSSIYVFSYFPFGFEGRIWDLIVSVPDHCLSFYFIYWILDWTRIYAKAKVLKT